MLIFEVCMADKGGLIYVFGLMSGLGQRLGRRWRIGGATGMGECIH